MLDKHLAQVFWSMNFRSRKTEETSRFSFFRSLHFFEHLSNKQIKILSRILQERRYEENEFLFEINHPGAALFFVSRGEVAIEVTDQAGQPEIIAHIKPNAFLGEMALLDDSPRSASARAVRPVVAYALSRADLLRLEVENPDISSEIFKSLAFIIGERLKATNRFVGTTRKAA